MQLAVTFDYEKYILKRPLKKYIIIMDIELTTECEFPKITMSQKDLVLWKKSYWAT